MNNESTSSTRRGSRAPEPSASPTASETTADPLRQLLSAMKDVYPGDSSVQLPLHWDGIEGKLAASFNEIIASNRQLLGVLRQWLHR